MHNLGFIISTLFLMTTWWLYNVHASGCALKQCDESVSLNCTDLNMTISWDTLHKDDYYSVMYCDKYNSQAWLEIPHCTNISTHSCYLSTVIAMSDLSDRHFVRFSSRFDNIGCRVEVRPAVCVTVGVPDITQSWTTKDELSITVAAPMTPYSNELEYIRLDDRSLPMPLMHYNATLTPSIPRNMRLTAPLRTTSDALMQRSVIASESGEIVFRNLAPATKYIVDVVAFIDDKQGKQHDIRVLQTKGIPLGSITAIAILLLILLMTITMLLYVRRQWMVSAAKLRLIDLNKPLRVVHKPDTPEHKFHVIEEEIFDPLTSHNGNIYTSHPILNITLNPLQTKESPDKTLERPSSIERSPEDGTLNSGFNHKNIRVKPTSIDITRPNSMLHRQQEIDAIFFSNGRHPVVVADMVPVTRQERDSIVGSSDETTETVSTYVSLETAFVSKIVQHLDPEPEIEISLGKYPQIPKCNSLG